MTPAGLDEKWSTLERMERRDAYDILRVSSDCHPEVSVGISPLSERCLILSLPKDFRYEFRAIQREKLSLAMVGDRDVVVTLLDRAFIDLFDDLIVSMHNQVKNVVDVAEYASGFVKIFHKWSQFFDASQTGLLSKDIIRGLFGELVVLRHLILEFAGSQINEVLESWRGPYDQGPDFVLDSKDIEVKTRTPDNASIHVANEDQLEQRAGKGLELAVVTLESEGEGGQTLEALSNDVIGLIENRLGDTSILYTALLQKGLSPQSLETYNDYKFRAVRLGIFDCLAEFFPRLIRSRLSGSIASVRYSINTADLTDFTVQQVDFDRR